MKTLSRHSILILIALSMYSSCTLINPEEDVPAFVHVSPIVLETEPGQGTPTHNFVDAWFFVEGQYLGTYELPATVPVLRTGENVEITVFAGIKDNGFSSTRKQYGFCDPYVVDLDLLPSEVDTIVPVVSYLDDLLSFHVLNFEDPLVPLVEASNSDTSIVRIPSPNPENTNLEEFVGSVTLDSENDFFRLISELELPIGGKGFCYLEMDYRTTTRFFMGLRRTFPFPDEISLIGMNPTVTDSGELEWRRIYIDLSEAIDLLGNVPEYEIFFQGGTVGTDAEILMDNIKVVYPN